MLDTVPGVTVVAEHSGVKSFVPCIPGETSDGYHTFDELYKHRCTLFCAFLKLYQGPKWRSLLHEDGSSFDGWFVAGCDLGEGVSITYHLPIELWDLCPATPLPHAPPFDGHTSHDVIERMVAFLMI